MAAVTSLDDPAPRGSTTMTHQEVPAQTMAAAQTVAAPAPGDPPPSGSNVETLQEEPEKKGDYDYIGEHFTLPHTFPWTP